MFRVLKFFLLSLTLITSAQSFANVDNSLDANGQDAASLCMTSFKEIRDRVMGTTAQSVIVMTGDGNLSPFITLQSSASNGNHYVLWQSLNGDVRGYALRNGKGFDYSNSAFNTLPLTWHPTLIWDNLFG